MKIETDECKQLESIVDLYLDGQLSSESRSALERHLSNCPFCLRKLEGRRMLVKRIHQAGLNVEVPPHLAAKALESAQGGLKSLAHSYYKWVVGLAAALLLVIVVGFWFYTQPLSAGQLQTFEGKLVCMGKKLEERYQVHRDCTNYGHLPVIETSTGELWHLVNNEAAHELALNMNDTDSVSVQVVAYVYPKEHFLEIKTYQRLPSTF